MQNKSLLKKLLKIVYHRYYVIDITIEIYRFIQFREVL